MGSLAQKAPERAPAKSGSPQRAHVEQSREMSPIQRLQRRIGNQALQRMLQTQASNAKENAAASESARSSPDVSQIPMRSDASVRIQPKLTINAPGDIHEQEADRVAGEVMRMPEPGRSSASGYPKREGGQSSHAQMQMKSAQTGDSGGATAPPIVHEVLRSPGQPLDAATRGFMEPRFGQDLGHVRVHTDAQAVESAAAVNARAYTVGSDIVFGSGEYVPAASEGRHLLAHELAHTNQPNARLSRREKDEEFPFVGYIQNAWSVALRESPSISKSDPHTGTNYDLPKGHEVTVISRVKGFYRVKTNAPDDHRPNQKKGTLVDGYVSHELVKKKTPDAIVTKESVSLDDALLLMTSTKRLKKDHAFTAAETLKLSAAKKVIEDTGKYAVNMSTYEVSFKAGGGKEKGEKPKVNTIEDFIIFVEDVERHHPEATPKQIVSEIRQMWNSDENWTILVASQGIINPGKSGKARYFDIEDTTASPIARKYDLPAELGAAGKGKQINIRGQLVDIGHVIAGLDASLSGATKSFPGKLTDLQLGAKYWLLKFKSGGDVRDFATFAGDIGQAYGEFLAEKYVNKSRTTFKTYYSSKAGDVQLRGDVHGYILRQTVAPEKEPSEGESTISDMLKTFYLQKPARGSESSVKSSYKTQVIKISGTKETLKAFIKERALRFAYIWYLKKEIDFEKAEEARGIVRPMSESQFLLDFDKIHEMNVASRPDDQIDLLIDHFMSVLDEMDKEALAATPESSSKK